MRGLHWVVPMGLLPLPLGKFCKHKIVCPLSPPQCACLANKRSVSLCVVGSAIERMDAGLLSWSSRSCLHLHFASFQSGNLRIVKHLEEAHTNKMKDPSEKLAIGKPES